MYTIQALSEFSPRTKNLVAILMAQFNAVMHPQSSNAPIDLEDSAYSKSHQLESELLGLLYRAVAEHEDIINQ